MFLNHGDRNLKVFTMLCFFGGLLSITAHAKEDKEHFFYKTYNYAKSSEILNTAAKCELASLKLGLLDSNKFYTKAVATLSMNYEYASHALLEYELAFDVVKNYHYGRFSVIDTYNKDAGSSGYEYVYKSLKCESLLQ